MKISTEKPIEKEKKEMNVKIEKVEEKGAIKIEEKIIEEKKGEDDAICIPVLRGKWISLQCMCLLKINILMFLLFCQYYK